MPTPVAFREESTGTPLTHRCKNPACGVTFPHRPRGGNEFCTDKCRWSCDANARQVLHRLSSRRAFLGLSTQALVALTSALNTRQSTSSERRETTSGELRELDRLLVERGPNHADVRADVRSRADAIRLRFEFEKPASLAEMYQYIRTLEILRDVGVESRADIRKLREFGSAAVRFYLDRKDFPRLGQALQAYANTCRLDEDPHAARRMTRYAYHILSEKCDAKDIIVARLLHQSAFWDLRLFGEDSREETTRMRRQREQMLRLADQVDTPKIWLETRRELAGYWTMRGKYDEAQQQLMELEKVRRRIPDLPSFAACTLARPGIEFLLASGTHSDKDEAIYRIETEYSACYRKDPQLYDYRQLQRWVHRFGLSLRLPRPAYASAMFIYLPRAGVE